MNKFSAEKTPVRVVGGVKPPGGCDALPSLSLGATPSFSLSPLVRRQVLPLRSSFLFMCCREKPLRGQKKELGKKLCRLPSCSSTAGHFFPVVRACAHKFDAPAPFPTPLLHFPAPHVFPSGVTCCRGRRRARRWHPTPPASVFQRAPYTRALVRCTRNPCCPTPNADLPPDIPALSRALLQRMRKGEKKNLFGSVLCLKTGPHTQ